MGRRFKRFSAALSILAAFALTGCGDNDKTAQKINDAKLEFKKEIADLNAQVTAAEKKAAEAQTKATADKAAALAK